MLRLSNKRQKTKAVETGILKMGGCSESCAVVYRYRKSRPGSITEMSNRSPGGDGFIRSYRHFSSETKE